MLVGHEKHGVFPPIDPPLKDLVKSSNFFLITVNENLLYLKFDYLSRLLFRRLYCIQEVLDACS